MALFNIGIGPRQPSIEDIQQRLMGLLGPQEAAGPVQPGMPQPQIEGLLPQNVAQTLSGLIADPITRQLGTQMLQQQFAPPEAQKPTSLMQNVAAIQSLRLEGKTKEADTIEKILLKPQFQIVQGGLSPGQKSVDQGFANEYVEYVAAGGFSDTKKQLGQLRQVSSELRTGKDITGPSVGVIPRSIRSVINPKSIAVQDSVEEVVQRNLRLILGAQFTEEEGKRLIERAYNPLLSQSENKKRIDRLIVQIEDAARAKQAAGKYYEQHGTLKGFKGKIPSLEDFGLVPEQRVPVQNNLPQLPPGFRID